MCDALLDQIFACEIRDVILERYSFSWWPKMRKTKIVKLLDGSSKFRVLKFKGYFLVCEENNQKMDF